MGTDLITHVSQAIHDTGELPPFAVERVAVAAITATLNHLADQWQSAEAYIVVDNWHEAEVHDVNITDWLRHQAEQIGADHG